MKRLNYIDGLKGWCALSISISHFLLMFFIGGFIGWKCLPEAATRTMTA
jgi:peptidoglycan/LPS O-acetylase OafA/YrhL